MADDSEQLDEATAGLVSSFAAVSSIRSDSLSGPVALARCRALLQLGEQLTAVIGQALRDVSDRELFALDDMGSTRSWLRTLPCGEGQHYSRARQLGRHPAVDAALLAGGLSAATAGTVCAQLDRIPDEVPDDQLYGVLVHAVPDLLSSWTGGLVADDPVTDELIARREQAAAVLRACAEDTLAAPAERLEPVFVLLAEAVTPAHLQSSLRAIVDALLPEQLADSEQDGYDDTYLRIRRVASGWDVTVHLDDIAGQSFLDQLEAKLTALLRGPQPTADIEPDAEPAEQPVIQDELPLADQDTDQDADVVTLHPTGARDDVHQTGDVEDGDADVDDLDLDLDLDLEHPDVVQGPVVRSRNQNLYDAFLALLLDAAAGLGLGQPRSTPLTVVTTLGGLEGQPGALPGTLTTSYGAIPLPVDTVRRLGCHSELSAVLLDATGNPVGASGTHRHATRRERRALRAQWGPTCAVLGCTNTVLIPHHVEPWWLSRRTRLRDLLPICEHHHHDIHEGHRTLRIRDGRLITPTGWASATAQAA